MFKNLDPQDISIKPFKSFKNFTFTNNDSGSGVFLIAARSGSQFNYISSSDAITSITAAQYLLLRISRHPQVAPEIGLERECHHEQDYLLHYLKVPP